MRTITLGSAFVALGLVVLAGCNTSADENIPPRPPESAGRTAGDFCAPGNSPKAEDAPDAPCAIRTEYHVPDFALGDAPKATDDAPPSPPAEGEGGELTTQNLSPLDNPGTAIKSCNGKTGPGFTTCGAQGSDNCCRANTVPAGRAGTLEVKHAFDLGVYEVTSGRFQAFVTAVGGNLRNAASSGQLGEPAKALAPKLPATLADVDRELGPGCKFRSDIANYGARTWPASDIPTKVASFITDDNARAADIRDDASAARLSAKPINCTSYQMAAAFCAWDGGRLPANSEWAYAAIGGEELRTFPWGAGRTADRLVTDLEQNAYSFTYPADFPFYGNGFNAYHIAPPGRKPAGAGRWGHQDMAGNVLEWMAEASASGGIVRGGSWEGHADKNSEAYTNYPLDRTYGSVGFRCAYGTTQPVAQPVPQPGPAPAPAPAPVAETRPIHRHYNAKIRDHLLGTTQGEGAPAWKYEHLTFRMLVAQAPGTVPVYRCRYGGSFHMLSNTANCEGTTVEGLLGYVYAAETPNTVPIYRCWSVRGNDHITTPWPQECVAGSYRIEGRHGFAPIP